MDYKNLWNFIEKTQKWYYSLRHLDYQKAPSFTTNLFQSKNPIFEVLKEMKKLKLTSGRKDKFREPLQNHKTKGTLGKTRFQEKLNRSPWVFTVMPLLQIS